MKKIQKQLQQAFIGSDFMLETLYSSQTGPVLINGERSNIDVTQSLNLKYLIYYSYHYIYDLISIFEILKRSKSIELKKFKKEINSFTNTNNAKIINAITNNSIHYKKKDLITVSYCHNQFKVKYVFCDLPFYILGTNGLRGAQKNWDLSYTTNISYSDLIRKTDYIRVNLELQKPNDSVTNTFSIIELISFLNALRKDILELLTKIGVKIPDYEKNDYIKTD